jgi:hypothetical protein
MRRLALMTALALLPLADTPARRAVVARRARQQCPAVKVTCPDTHRPGGELTFDAEVDTAASAVKNTFTWEISAGSISGGQGTPSLKVDVTGLGGQAVTATVEVGGLPAACVRRAACATAVIRDDFGCGFDEYGNVTWENEQARLDNFAIELQNDPTAQGYLVCYGGRKGRTGEAQRRCDRAKDYLVTTRGITADRIVTVDGGFREDLTVELWIVPSGATPPQSTPTVDPSEVQPARAPSGRRRRGRDDDEE